MQRSPYETLDLPVFWTWTQSPCESSKLRFYRIFESEVLRDLALPVFRETDLRPLRDLDEGELVFLDAGPLRDLEAAPLPDL
jgi:hypothetical protein